MQVGALLMYKVHAGDASCHTLLVAVQTPGLSSVCPAASLGPPSQHTISTPTYTSPPPSPQAEALHSPGVLEGGNLVYCAPTSGGKSLVAEVLLLRRVIATRRPALLVLPYVSLCGQKAAALEALLRPVGLEVKELYGPHHSGTLLAANTGEGARGCAVSVLQKPQGKHTCDTALAHLQAPCPPLGSAVSCSACPPATWAPLPV